MQIMDELQLSVRERTGRGMHAYRRQLQGSQRQGAVASTPRGDASPGTELGPGLARGLAGD